MGTVLRLASRTSPLALYQAELVASLLRSAHPSLEVVIVGVKSSGDVDADRPIRAFTERGVFTAEVDRAVSEERADVGVHSAKDLPASEDNPDVVLGAVPQRIDPRDVLVGARLLELGPGAIIATGSVRRRAQLAFVRGDLGFTELRGNIATRLSRIPHAGALVMAKAALVRLQIEPDVVEVLDTTTMLPQVGQGAIGLRCRSGDATTLKLLAAIDDVAAHRAVRAERAFLRRLGGGCDAPVAAYAVDVDGELEIEAMIARPDGHLVTKERQRGSDPEALGDAVAQSLLVRRGASSVLDLATGR